MFCLNKASDKTKDSRRFGFSLVEIVVVITIMAILIALLTPALLSYVEKSRAQKDVSATDEIVNAVELSLAEPEIADEVRAFYQRNNVACYIDKETEAGYDNYKQTSTQNASKGYYYFDSNARISDEVIYHGAGNMTGVTITFTPEEVANGSETNFVLKNGQINKFNGGGGYMGTDLPKLTNKIISILAEKIDRDSQTYRNSDFTIFIRTGSIGGTADSTLDIYGQYNGTNLPEPAPQNPPITTDRETITLPNPPINPSPEPGEGGGDGGGGGTVTPTPPPPVTPPTTPPHTHAYVDKIVPATCENKGYTEHVCDCGHSFRDKEVAALGHQWKQQGTPATCTTPGSTVQVCTRSGCGAKQGQSSSPALGHDMKDGLRIESTCIKQGQISKKCSRCDYSITEKLPLAEHKWSTNTIKAPTCTATGLKQDVCGVCKGTQNDVVIPANGHKWVKKTETATCTMPGIVYDECSVCKTQQNRHTSQALGHDYRETKRVDSTCTTQGYIVRACSRQGCTESVTTKLDLLSHNYKHVVERAATCQQTGYEYDKCAMCSLKINEQTKPVLPHNMVEVGRIEPTCSQEGSITTQCSMCKVVNRTTLPKTQHTYETKVQNATCTVAGYAKQICKHCGHVASNRVINALGHNFNAGARVDPTCTSEGNITKTCQRAGCGEKVVETLNALGHNWTQRSTTGTCTTPGKTWEQCIRCNAIRNEQTNAAAGHKYVEQSRVNPTCTVNGSVTYRCSVCGHTKTDTLFATGAHNMVTGQVHAPTCIQAGWTDRRCSMCTYADRLPGAAALGHNLTIKVSETQPTYDRPGSKVMQCSRPNCNYQETQSIPALKNNKVYAFWSEPDQSINYVRSATPLMVGSYCNGKIVSAILMDDIEYTPRYSTNPSDWKNDTTRNPICDYNRKAQHIYYFDEIYPVNANYWYCGLPATTQIHNPERLNLSKARTTYMFFQSNKMPDIDPLIRLLDTRNMEVMEQMFAEVSDTNIDVSHLNTSKVTNFKGMFRSYAGETLDLSSFDTRNAKELSYMFNMVKSKTIDLSSFETSSVIDMSQMFYFSSVGTVYASEKFVVKSGTNTQGMFDSTRNIVGGNGTRYNTYFIDGAYAKIDKPGQVGYFTDKNYKPSFTPVDGGKPYTDDTHPCAVLCMDGTLYIERVKTNNEYMLGDLFVHTTSPSKIIGIIYLDENIAYSGISPLESPASFEGLHFYDQSTRDKVLRVKIIDEYRPTSAPYLFRDFKNCSSWDVRNLNTEMCNELYGMFKNCGSALPSSTNLVLELPGLKTKNDVNAHDMFAGSAFDRISVDQGKLTEINTTQGQNMFKGCVNLIGGNGTRYDETKIHGDMAVVDKYNRPGYFSQLP